MNFIVLVDAAQQTQWKNLQLEKLTEPDISQSLYLLKLLQDRYSWVRQVTWHGAGLLPASQILMLGDFRFISNDIQSSNQLFMWQWK